MVILMKAPITKHPWREDTKSSCSTNTKEFDDMLTEQDKIEQYEEGSDSDADAFAVIMILIIVGITLFHYLNG